MTEPKPVIGPLANEVGAAPVPPLSTPPPQPAASTPASNHDANARTRTERELVNINDPFAPGDGASLRATMSAAGGVAAGGLLMAS